MPAKPSPTPNTVDYQTLAEFRHELRTFLRYSEEIARDAGLEPQQHQLLLAIKGAPAGEEVSISYLSEHLQLKHNSIVGLVDRLQARRLVRRKPSTRDRRRVTVEITAAGEARLHQLSERNLEVLRSTRGLLRSLTKLVREAHIPAPED